MQEVMLLIKSGEEIAVQKSLMQYVLIYVVICGYLCICALSEFMLT